VPGVNDRISPRTARTRHRGVSGGHAIVCLNSDPHHLISNFPPTIETIQDEVLHASAQLWLPENRRRLRMLPFGAALAARSAITKEQFSGNGFPRERMAQILEWNRQHGVTRLRV